MGKFAVGQIVSCAFPFSNLAAQKYRPALVVAVVDFDDLILCQITSKPYASSNPIALRASDFAKGGLPVDSYIRPDKLFTADSSIVSRVYGAVTPKKLEQVYLAIRALFKHGH